MRIARELELRLERLVEGLSAALFRGRMHPVDVANRLVRILDLSVEVGRAGPTIANQLVIRIHPSEVSADVDAARLEAELARVVATTAEEKGWKIGGPITVELVRDRSVRSGSIALDRGRAPGQLRPWGQLIAKSGGTVHELGDNRVLIGRSPEADVTISHQRVSRAHAIVYREGGAVWIVDLGSANGTSVNGESVGRSPVPLRTGDSVSLGPATFSLRLL